VPTRLANETCAKQGVDTAQEAKRDPSPGEICPDQEWESESLAGFAVSQMTWRSPVIVEFTRYKIDERRRGAFERDYQKAGESLTASSHRLAYQLSQCAEDSDHCKLRIEWDSEEDHLKGFRSSPEFKTFFNVVQPYVKAIAEMRHYQFISLGGKAR
jgi:quinol monooxygenase YgiN